MLAQTHALSCRTLHPNRASTRMPQAQPPAQSAMRRAPARTPAKCMAISPTDVMEAARLTAFTTVSVGGFVAGVELARQANQALTLGRMMAPQSKAERRKDPVFLATLLALDLFLVSSMGLASAGIAHGLLAQMPQ